MQLFVSTKYEKPILMILIFNLNNYFNNTCKGYVKQVDI